MRKQSWMLLIIVIFALLPAACGATNTDAPAKAVNDYLNALVAKDAGRLPTLVCGAWEDNALLELNSLQAVSARLEEVSCNQTGVDGNTTLVKCAGNIVLTYDTEDQKLDLSTRTYEVVKEGGAWLVCGTR